MASEKLMVHVPMQAGIMKQRMATAVGAPVLQETPTMSDGLVGRRSLHTTFPNDGRITPPRRDRSSSVKPEARVERMEMIAMGVNFMVEGEDV